MNKLFYVFLCTLLCSNIQSGAMTMNEALEEQFKRYDHEFGDIEAGGLIVTGDLHRAVRAGKTNIVKIILRSIPNVFITDVDAREAGETALHLAAKAGNPEIVRLLLDRGADINARDQQKFAPLHVAAYNNEKAVVQLLLERGADVNARDKTGATALWWATEEDYPEIVELIQKYMPAKKQ